MNVSGEPIHSLESVSAERTRAGIRWLRRDTIAVRLQVRHLKLPVTLDSDLTELENQASSEETAGAEDCSDLRNLIDSVVKVVNCFHRRARRIWYSMSVPFPEPRIRLMPIHQIDSFEMQMNKLCADFQRQAKQPKLNSAIGTTFGPRDLSGMMLGPVNTANFLCGSFGIRWDYPSLEPDSRLETLSRQLYQEERERRSGRFRWAAEEAHATLLGEVMRLSNKALELLRDQSGNAAHRVGRLGRLAEGFLRLQRLNVARDPAIDMLFDEASAFLKKVKAKDLQTGGLTAERLAATVRWVSSEFLVLRGSIMYPKSVV